MTEQAAREKAEAEAARLRQENQARRDLGLLARLLARFGGIRLAAVSFVASPEPLAAGLSSK